MRLKQEARVLKAKSVSSFVSFTEAFNSTRNDGRVTRVLLHLQHAFEMLLKAALVQGGTSVFDKKTGRSIGFEKCVNLAASHELIKLGESDAGTLRAIDAMRDDEQHWFSEVPEQLMYLHARAGVTLFDEVLHRAFGERLTGHLPARVLPISTEAPRDLALLLDDEYAQIGALLQPGRRARPQARARIRTLLAMEAHVGPEAGVSSKDVDRVERGIRSGSPRDQVFPLLNQIGTSIDGDGLAVIVHFTKAQGAPVRFEADAAVPAAAIRELDLQRKYHRTAKELATAVGLTPPRATALRRHLDVDEDQDCCRVFVFGKSRHRMYSDNAYKLMKAAAGDINMDAVWGAHRPRAGRADASATCMQAGCRAG